MSELLSGEDIAAFEVSGSLSDHRGFLGCLGLVINRRQSSRPEHRVGDPAEESLSLIIGQFIDQTVERFFRRHVSAPQRPKIHMLRTRSRG
ncbi:MAG TPA: hypothetical protein VFH48_27090 [Chloroflexota bacterium]|nr:hypothetical protein [Chloroflexota bacterium]